MDSDDEALLQAMQHVLMGLDEGEEAWEGVDPDPDLEEHVPRRRRQKNREDVLVGRWMTMLAGREVLLDLTSPEAKRFRLRFRVPFHVFEMLIAMTIEGKHICCDRFDATGRAFL